MVAVAALVIWNLQISREQKKDILSIFKQEFNLSASQATDLFSASSYLLRDEDHLAANIDKVIEKSKPQFTAQLQESLLQLVERVCRLDGSINDSQSALLSALQKCFDNERASNTQWG